MDIGTKLPLNLGYFHIMLQASFIEGTDIILTLSGYCGYGDICGVNYQKKFDLVLGWEIFTG